MDKHERARLAGLAGKMADDTFAQAGLNGMRVWLTCLRRSEANPVIIAEFERLYHNRVAPGPCTDHAQLGGYGPQFNDGDYQDGE